MILYRLQFPQQLYNCGRILGPITPLHGQTIPLNYIVAVKIRNSHFVAQFPGQAQILQALGDG